MKTLNLTQGSDEWKAARGKYRPASHAPAMMGAGKISRSELVRMKATGDEQEFSRWITEVLFERGHEIEALARPIAEAFIGDELYPVTGVCDNDYLLASLDGLTLLGDVCWECKSWNADKVAAVEDGRIPECDFWQVVQQLVVTGAERVLYTVSDGTEENTRHVWYSLQPGDAESLYDHWRQFDADVEAYVPQEAAPVVVGRAPEDLPALRVEVSGMVTASNMDAFREHALSVFSGINRDLSTDADFANADKTVKWCKKVEDKLEAAKAQALEQTADIDALFQTIDTVKDEARAVRLELDKLVKARKKEIRDEILAGGQEALKQYRAELNTDPALVAARVEVPKVDVDFAGAMKGKRNIDSLRDAVATALAGARVELDRLSERIRANLAAYEEHRENYGGLFRDLQLLVLKEPADFIAQVKLRIAEEQERQDRVLAEEAKRQEELAARQAAASVPAGDVPPDAGMPCPNPAPGQDASTRSLTGRASAGTPQRPTYGDVLRLMAREYNVGLDVADTWLRELLAQQAA